MQKLNLALALGAGLLGGVISRNVSLLPVHAQNPPAPAPAAAQEVRAQSFTLVDKMDHTVGTLRVEPSAWQNGPSRIVLRDAFGFEIWSADRGSATRALPITQR